MNYLRSRTVRGVCSIFVLATLGCHHEDLLMPSTTPTSPASHSVAALVEITIRDIGKPTMRAEALVAHSMAELNVLRAARALYGKSKWGAAFDLTVPKGQDGVFGNATIQLDPLSAGAFDANGQRYFQAGFRVRNAQKTDSVPFNTARTNLTFVPVSTAGTILDSPVSVWLRSDSTPANTALVRQLKPTGLATTEVAGRVIGFGPDVLQVVTEAEVAAGSVPAAGRNIFPYGFMTRRENDNTTRELPPSPDPDDFAGVMTIAFRLPLQVNNEDNPTTITLIMLALDDSQVRITQSLEEQDPVSAAAVQARATSLGADTVRTLPGNPGTFTQPTELICSVRTAGFRAAPTANLTNVAGLDTLIP